MILLELYDELFEGAGCEFLAFCGIEIDVCGFDGCRDIGIDDGSTRGAIPDCDIWSGCDDAVFESFEFDLDLDSMELERCEGERLSGVLGEPEWEGYIEHSCSP